MATGNDRRDIIAGLADNRAFVALFLSVAVFAAHFLYFRSFGLYEDDFSFFPKYLGRDLNALTEIFMERLAPVLRLDLGTAGRPLAAFFQEAAAVVGSRFAGLDGVYVVAFFLEALNAFLSFLLLKKIGPPVFALSGALVFALFPADTLHPFLNAAFGVRPGTTFLLLALISYLGERKFAPYALVTLALLSYESMYFPFLAAPLLLDLKWDRRFVKKFLIHAVVTLAILVAIMILRSGSGEGRVAGMASYAAEIPLREAQSIAIGLFVSAFYSYLIAIKNVAINIDLRMTLFIGAFFVALLALFIRAGQGAETGAGRFKKLILAGLVLIALSYATAFYELYQQLLSHGALYGRSSRVHIPAAIGSALFVPSVFFLAREYFIGKGLGKLALPTLALLLAMLVGYGQLMQYDYKNGWSAQKKLWTTILKSSPDLDDATLVIVEGKGLPQTKYIDSHSWFGVPHALHYIHAFPRDWQQPPRMNYKIAGWLERDIRMGADGLEIYIERPHHYNSSPARWEKLPESNIMLFRYDNGRFARVGGVLDANGKKITLKPMPNVLSKEPAWPKGVLYNELIIPTEYMVGKIFDGRTQTSFALPGAAGTKDFTIEFWVSSSEKELVERAYTSSYPPMPGVFGPLRLDQFSDEKLVITLMGDDNADMPFNVALKGTGEWTHVELSYEGASGAVSLFEDGRLIKKTAGVKTSLKDRIVLGKGFAERYWRGRIADLRISSTARHKENFNPYETSVKKDAQTLFLLDGEPLAFKNVNR